MGYGFAYFLVDQKNYYDLNDKKTNQLFVICVPHPDINCDPINNPEWSIAAFGWAKIDSQKEIDGVKIFKLVPNPSGQKE